MDRSASPRLSPEPRGHSDTVAPNAQPVAAMAAVAAGGTVTTDATVAADSAVAACAAGDLPVATERSAADANGSVPCHRWSHGSQRAGDARRRNLLRRAERQKNPSGRKFCTFFMT